MYLIPRTKECALMTSPWQLRVTSALSLFMRKSANWAIKRVLSAKLMLSQGSEMLSATPMTNRSIEQEEFQ